MKHYILKIAVIMIAVGFAATSFVVIIQINLPRRGMDIVLVRRVTRPVAAGGVNLANQQAMGREARLNHVIDLARRIAAPANFHPDIRRTHQPRGMPFLSPGVAEGHVRLRLGSQLEIGLDRQIEGERQPLKHVSPSTKGGK